MKRVALLVVAIILTVSMPYAQTTLPHSFKVAHASGAVRWSQCAFGPDGILHTIWEEDTDRGHPIFYVSYDGTTASTPFNVTNSLDRRAERPGIHVGSKGHIVVVWGEDSGNNIYMRMYDPKLKAWQAVEAVALGYGWDEPCPAVDAEGNIHVFFSDDSGGRAYCRSKIGGVWENVYRLTGGYGKQGGVAVAPNGTVWAVWREKQGNGNYKSYYSKRTKSTLWTPGQMVTSGGGSSSHPFLGVGPNGVCVLVFGDIDPLNETGAEIRLWKIEVSQTREIIVPFAMQHYPRPAVDANNNIHVAIQLRGGDFGDGTKYLNNIGGKWNDPQTMPATWPKLPGISADPFGNVAVCQSSIIFAAPEGSDIWVYTLLKIEPKVFYTPLNLASSISLKSIRRNPEITYSLTWAANPANIDSLVQGYNLYVNEGSGYKVLATVSKTTFASTFKYTDLSKKRAFALSTIGIGGIETDLVYFK